MHSSVPLFLSTNIIPRFALQGMALGLLMCCPFFLVAQNTIAFSELNYHSDSVRNSGDWLELHNYGASTVLLTGWYLRDGVPTNRWNFPAGTTISPNGYLVVSVDVAGFNSVYPFVSNVIGEPGFRFSNSGELLRLFNASNEVVASMAYQDSLPWQEGSDGHGRTLEVIDPQGDLNDPFNWFDGCMYGSPGEPYTPCDPRLVFSEINYNPPLVGNAGDWVELWNRSGSTIDLSGWDFKDQRDTNEFVLPAGTMLDPGEYLVLCRDLALFSSVHPDVENVLGSFGFNLSGDGEVIRLFNASGSIEFSVVYNDAIPWPQPPDGLGATLELINPSGPMNRYTNWFDGCPLGSPGGPFVPSCWTASIDEQALDALDLSVNFQGLLVQNAGYQQGTIIVYDIMGRPRGQADLLASASTSLTLHSFPTGVYYVEARMENGSRRVFPIYWPGL
jgi:hypothetical protein